MFVAHMYVAKRDLESELPRELRLKRFPPSARFTVRKSPATRTSNGRLGVSGKCRKTFRDSNWAFARFCHDPFLVSSSFRAWKDRISCEIFYEINFFFVLTLLKYSILFMFQEKGKVKYLALKIPCVYRIINLVNQCERLNMLLANIGGLILRFFR